MTTLYVRNVGPWGRNVPRRRLWEQMEPADVVLLQEVWSDRAQRDWKKRRKWAWKKRKKGFLGFQTGLLTLSQLPVLQKHWIPFPYPPDPQAFFNGGDVTPKGCLLCMVRTRHGLVWLGNWHCDAGGDAASQHERHRQIQGVLRWARTTIHPVVLAGDPNLRQDKAHRPLDMQAHHELLTDGFDPVVMPDREAARIYVRGLPSATGSVLEDVPGDAEPELSDHVGLRLEI